MSIVLRGSPITFTIQFYDSLSGEPVDPDFDNDQPTLTVSLEDDVVAGPFTYDSGDGVITRHAEGLFRYTWIVPADFDEGLYQAEWEGAIGDEPVERIQEFDVVTSLDMSLEADYELVFMTETTPLWIDPSELTILFPNIPYVDIVEQVYFHSQAMLARFGEDAIDNYKVIEYIKAAVACSLSRAYELNFTADDEQMLALGDFRVQHGDSGVTAAINAGSVNNWCDLAALLLSELSRGQAGIKAVVRAGNQCNPMPRRHLRRVD